MGGPCHNAYMQPEQAFQNEVCTQKDISGTPIGTIGVRATVQVATGVERTQSDIEELSAEWEKQKRLAEVDIISLRIEVLRLQTELAFLVEERLAVDATTNTTTSNAQVTELPAHQQLLRSLQLPKPPWLQALPGLGRSHSQWQLRDLLRGPLLLAAVLAGAGYAATIAMRAGSLDRLLKSRQPVEATATVAAPVKRTVSAPGTVLDLSRGDYDKVVNQSPATFVMFHTPWCPYCRRMEPDWDKLARLLPEAGLDVQIARVDAELFPDIADRYRLPGYPSLLLFREEGEYVASHRGPRDALSLQAFVATRLQAQ
eukprot:jgi/Chlat1/802/Chrsp104S08611